MNYLVWARNLTKTRNQSWQRFFASKTMSVPINAFHLMRTYAIIRILISVILWLKRSQWEKGYTFLQWRDCQNYHNYRRREVVSLISLRPPLQVGFNGDFWDISYQLSWNTLCFLFFRGGGGRSGAGWAKISVLDTLVKL